MIEMQANNQESAKPVEAFKAALGKALSDFQIPALNDEQLHQLAGHFQLMTAWNRHTNLTRITGPEEAARLHYAESLFGARLLAGARKVLDVGSGAGFPALPLAVACPELEVTALEANQKKALFLLEVKDALQLGNFQIARARIEDFDIGPYDFLTSRALDRAEALLPKLIKKMNPQQRLLLYCAPEMVAHLKASLTTDGSIKTEPIPFASTRLIALLSHR
jgi:16S rRNA (guanine527-N7)-methyltransferase